MPLCLAVVTKIQQEAYAEKLCGKTPQATGKRTQAVGLDSGQMTKSSLDLGRPGGLGQTVKVEKESSFQTCKSVERL